MDFSIQTKWGGLYQGITVPPPIVAAKRGWMTCPDPVEPFVEPSLKIRDDFETQNPDVILVAAPGAVGKSSYARQLAHICNLIFVDLAEAEAIGANYVVGGLVNTFGPQSISQLKSGQLSMVIDALDEAKIRVTPESFDAFLQSILDARQGPDARPIVLFGRSAVIEEAWVILDDKGASVAIAEIDFFNAEQAARFVDGYAQKFRKGSNPYVGPYQDCRNILIEKLRQETSTYDAAVPLEGYAPVLVAIARLLAEWGNYGGFPAPDSPEFPNIVAQIPQSILVREQEKVLPALQELLAGQVENFDALYSPGHYILD